MDTAASVNANQVGTDSVFLDFIQRGFYKDLGKSRGKIQRLASHLLLVV